jgi:hypothetical protein
VLQAAAPVSGAPSSTRPASPAGSSVFGAVSAASGSYTQQRRAPVGWGERHGAGARVLFGAVGAPLAAGMIWGLGRTAQSLTHR